MMMRILFVLIFSLIAFGAVAQKKDSTVYYLKNSGTGVKKKADADIIIAVFRPDKSLHESLYTVKGYYTNGTLMFVTSSANNSTLVFEGSYVGFYPNGQKMVVKTYEGGYITGDVTTYYPNGKFYSKANYTRDNKIIFEDYADSTGKILAANGKGIWVNYDDNFNKIEEGPIDSGYKEGKWRTRLSDTVYKVDIYKKGELDDSTNNHQSGGKIFTSVEQVPEFPGGLDSFGRFLALNVKYPAVARDNNIQGRVIISFVVEKDGTLNNIVVARGIGGGCDEEAVRVMKLSPHWKPGMQNGKPVRVEYSVPIKFTLSR